jgi:hypothetical protein
MSQEQVFHGVLQLKELEDNTLQVFEPPGYPGCIANNITSLPTTINRMNSGVLRIHFWPNKPVLATNGVL